jgi:hypothetical protein
MLPYNHFAFFYFQIFILIFILKSSRNITCDITCAHSNKHGYYTWHLKVTKKRKDDLNVMSTNFQLATSGRGQTSDGPIELRVGDWFYEWY